MLCYALKFGTGIKVKSNIAYQDEKNQYFNFQYFEVARVKILWMLNFMQLCLLLVPPILKWQNVTISSPKIIGSFDRNITTVCQQVQKSFLSSFNILSIIYDLKLMKMSSQGAQTHCKTINNRGQFQQRTIQVQDRLQLRSSHSSFNLIYKYEIWASTSLNSLLN